MPSTLPTPRSETLRPWSPATCARKLERLQKLTGWNQDQAARALGVSRITLLRWCGKTTREVSIPFTAQFTMAHWLGQLEARS